MRCERERGDRSEREVETDRQRTDGRHKQQTYYYIMRAGQSQHELALQFDFSSRKWRGEWEEERS